MNAHAPPIELYTDHVLAYAESQLHRGRFDHPTLSGTLRNPICGDVIRLDLVIDGGHVAAVRFDGRGCLVSRAGASLLCREIEGKTLTELRAMPAEAMLDLLEMPLTPLRRVCALLLWTCLQSILSKADARPPNATSNADREE